MKKNLLVVTAFAAMFASCANEELVQNAAINNDKLGTLIDVPFLGVNAGMNVDSRAYVESGTVGSLGKWAWLPVMNAGTGTIDSVDNIGLCWTGVNQNGVYGGPLAETGDMVYTNVKFEHIGWLYDGETASKFHCGDLENGAYSGWMGYTPTASYDPATKEWSVTGEDLNLEHGLFKSQNGTIYQGEYIVYFPYNDSFWNAPVTAVQDRIMTATIDAGEVADQRELISKHAFNIGYKSSIDGGADAEDFTTKLLSSGIHFNLEGTPEFDEIVLWAKGGQKAFLTRQALSAKKIKEVYNTGLTSDIYLTEDANNEASSTIVIKTAGLSQPSELTVPFLPNKINELHVMFVNTANGTVADMNLGEVTFKAGEFRPVNRNFVGNNVYKGTAIEANKVATFTAKNYAYDEESFQKAYKKAYDTGATTKTDASTVMLLDNIVLKSQITEYNGNTGAVYVETDETLVNEKNTITFAAGASANITYTFTNTSFEVNVETEAQGCCNNGQANLTLNNSAMVDGAALTVNGGALTFLNTVTLDGDVASKFEGVDEEGETHADRVPSIIVNENAKVTATKNVLVEGTMTIQKGDTYNPGVFTLKGADMTLEGELTVEGKGDSAKDAQLFMVMNGTDEAKLDNFGLISNHGSIDNDSKAGVFVNKANATFIDYVGSSLSGHRIVNEDATSKFICEVNSEVRYENAIALNGVRPTTIVRFVYGTDVNIGSGAFILNYTLKPNKDGGIYRPYPAGGVDKLIDFESNIDSGEFLGLLNAIEAGEAIATEIGNLTINSGALNMYHAALTVDGDFTAQNNATNIELIKGLDITGDLNLTKVSQKFDLDGEQELTVGGDINVTSVTNGVNFWQNSVVNALNLNVAAGNTVKFHKNQETFLGEGVATAGVLTNNGTVDIVNAVSGSDVPAKVWCNTRAGNGTYPNGKPQYYSE